MEYNWIAAPPKNETKKSHMTRRILNGAWFTLSPLWIASISTEQQKLMLELHFYKLYIYLQWNPIVIPTNMDYGFRHSDHFIRLFVHSFVRSFVPERSCARQFRSFLLYCSYSFYFPHSNFSFSLFVLVLIFKAKQKRRRKKLQNFSRSSLWYQDQTNRFQASIEFINKSIDHDHHHHHH